MKRWHFIVLALVVVGIVYVYLHRQEWGLTSSRTDDSGESLHSGLSALLVRPAHVNWRQVDRSPEGFKIEMPAEFKEIQVPVYNASGGEEMAEMIYSNPDAETTYAVTWADNPPVARGAERSPDRILDLARDNALARTQTKLAVETNPNIDGVMARDFSGGNSGGGVLNARLILSGTRLYMLIVTLPSARARNEEDVAHFFYSFSLNSANRVPESLPGAPAPVR
jgi:hypothetical protein